MCPTRAARSSVVAPMPSARRSIASPATAISTWPWAIACRPPSACGWPPTTCSTSRRRSWRTPTATAWRAATPCPRPMTRWAGRSPWAPRSASERCRTAVAAPGLACLQTGLDGRPTRHDDQTNGDKLMRTSIHSMAALAGLAAAALLAHGAARADAPPVIGLITKTETNPFFVKMKEGAAEAAKASGAKLLTGAGKVDGDNAGQVAAMENMIAAGARTILITAGDAKAIVPSIKKARAKGVLVIALDSPTDPVDAADALFATDNYQAGLLIGRYAKAALGGKPAKVVTLDLFP